MSHSTTSPQVVAAGGGRSLAQGHRSGRVRKGMRECGKRRGEAPVAVGDRGRCHTAVSCGIESCDKGRHDRVVAGVEAVVALQEAGCFIARTTAMGYTLRRSVNHRTLTLSFF